MKTPLEQQPDEAGVDQGAVYLWQGRDGFGRKLSGEIRADSQGDVRASLQRRGVRATRIRRRTTNGARRTAGRIRRRIKASDIALFSRQTATMIRAGVPLVQALDVVADGVRNDKLQTLVKDIRTDLSAGESLSVALARSPTHFDALYRNLVSIGEQSGTLESMLERIATYQERTQATIGKLRKAMSYPLIVTTVAVAVTAVLLIHVVPQFEAVFASVGAELPGFTRFVLGISDAFRNHWLVLFGGMALAVAGVVLGRRRSARFRNLVERVLLKSPIVGDILVKASVSRYARTLGTTVAAGVPLVDALRSVAGSTGNSVYATAVERLSDVVATGEPLQAAMRQSGLFPDMMIQMVAIGEQSGSLDDMLARAAVHFESLLDAAVDNLTTLVEPLMMAVLGALIGGLIVAMYLPVFQLGSAFGG